MDTTHSSGTRAHFRTNARMVPAQEEEDADTGRSEGGGSSIARFDLLDGDVGGDGDDDGHEQEESDRSEGEDDSSARGGEGEGGSGGCAPPALEG